MVIYRILRNLFFKFMSILLGPLYFIWPPLLNIGLPILLLYLLYLLFTGGGSGGTTQNGAVAYHSTAVQAVTKHEDGNSLYSTNLLAKMHNDERAYYAYMFDWAMENVQNNVTLPWEKFNIGGTMTPGEPFANGTGKTCRRFKEVLKVHEIQQTFEGIGCSDGKGGWCRLRRTDAPTCSIGYMSDWDRTKQQMGVGWRKFWNGVF